MQEIKVQLKTQRDYINCISGLFVSKKNPQGLTPAECTLISALLHKLPDQNSITKGVKIEVANMTNNKLQVITNYISKLRKKTVIIKNKLHPIFYVRNVKIQYGEAAL